MDVKDRDPLEVVSVTDPELGREVSVKRLRAGESSRVSSDRLVREARIQARLDHPAIPPIHELGKDAEGRPFFTMKKLGGQTLAEVLVRTSYRPQRLLRAFADACLAIELAHSKGVIHRDLTPANIVLGDFGELYVLDWGVAKVVGEGDDLPALNAGVIGTLGYSAPEQARGDRDVDARADVYSLGAILFEILAGQPLHPRGADGAAVLPGDQRPSKRAPDRDIPPEIDVLCGKAVAVDPAQRVPTARELGEGIHRFLDGDRDQPLRATLAREHLAAARRAFVDPDDEVASIAIREAGRALALDPKLDGAAELVTRIMLEPPRRTPHALAEAIAADQISTVRRMSRTAMWGYVAYLLFAPAFLWLGAGQGREALVMTMIILANVAVLWRQGFTTARPMAAAVAVGNAVLIALIAWLWSPFLAAPGLAGLTVMVSALSPLYRRTRFVVAMAVLMSGAVLAPFGLEMAGVITPTVHSVPGGLLFDPPGMNLREAGQWITAVMYVIALVAVSAALGSSFRGGERTMRERLLRIAWQLRQLVPT